MSKIPVHNPSIPFLGMVPGGMRHGTMIRIKGQMQSHGNRIVINLQSGAAINPSDSINLHMSIRPHEGVIVRNDYSSDGWGPEERIGGCPVHPGHFYEILILAENMQFKVAINGSHFCEFIHRQPLSEVRFIYVHGETTVNFIGLEGDSNQPPPPSMVMPNVPIPTMSPSAPPYQTSPSPPPVSYGGYNPPPHMPPPYNPPGIIHQPIHQNPPYNPQAAALSYGQPQTYPVVVQTKPPGLFDSAKNAVSSMVTSANKNIFNKPPTLIQTTYYQQMPQVQQPMPMQQHIYPTMQNPNPGYMGPNNPPYMMNQQHYPPPENKKNKYLKYAAVAGGVGLGTYVISRAFSGSDSD